MICPHISLLNILGLILSSESFSTNLRIFMISRQSISGSSNTKYLSTSPSINCMMELGSEPLSEQQKEVRMTSQKLNISSASLPSFSLSTMTSVIMLMVLMVSGLLLRYAQRIWQQPLNSLSSFLLPMRSWMQNSMFFQKSACSLYTKLDLPPQLHSDHTTIEMSLSVKVPELKPPVMMDQTFVQRRSRFQRLGTIEDGVMVKSQVMSPMSSDLQLKMFSRILGWILSTSSGVIRLVSQLAMQMEGSSWYSTSLAPGSFSTFPSRLMTFLPLSTSWMASATMARNLLQGRLEARLRIFRLFSQEIQKYSSSILVTNCSTNLSEKVSVFRYEYMTAMSSSWVKNARFSSTFASTLPRISILSSWFSLMLLAQCTIISTRLASGIWSKFLSKTASTTLKNDSQPSLSWPQRTPFTCSGLTLGERSCILMKFNMRNKLSYQ